MENYITKKLIALKVLRDQKSDIENEIKKLVEEILPVMPRGVPLRDGVTATRITMHRTVVTDSEALPDWAFSRSPDSKIITAWLKGGRELPGAVLIESQQIRFLQKRKS